MAKSRKKKRLSKTEKKKLEKARRKRAKRVSKPSKKKRKRVARKEFAPSIKKETVKRKLVHIVTEPPGAIVKVDGKIVGRSPVDVEFTPKVKKKYLKEKVSKPPARAPKGFELIPPEDLEDSTSSAAAKIRAAFEDAVTRFSYKNSHVMVHEYKYEVDGEWRIDGIRGEKTSDLLAEMLEALLPLPGVSTLSVLGFGFWITTGIRWQGKGSMDEKTNEWTDEDEDHYRKHEGMLEVSSNFRQMINRARILSAFNAVLEGSSKNPVPMWKSVEKKFHRKIAQVFIRINWNPRNKQPKRFKYGPE